MIVIDRSFKNLDRYSLIRYLFFFKRWKSFFFQIIKKSDFGLKNWLQNFYHKYFDISKAYFRNSATSKDKRFLTAVGCCKRESRTTLMKMNAEILISKLRISALFYQYL
jgi:hypothetical protein